MFFLKLPSIQIALQSRRNFSLALSKCFGTFYAAACMLVAEWTANAQTFVKAVLRALPFRARDDGQSGKISTSILRQGNPVAQTVTNVLVTVGGTTVATLAAFP